ncbi:MAG: Rieske 2Fe-2S domain-containing protein, partial [bacterium]|nr:Rieske 2Fe-2S domain-containing protein [bacterium]
MLADSKKTRRGFLGACLGVLGTIFAGGAIGTVVSYLIPPSRKNGEEVVRIFTKELPPGGMKRFHIRGIPAVAVHSKEGFAAFSLVCSHLGCLVKWEGEKNE